LAVPEKIFMTTSGFWKNPLLSPPGKNTFRCPWPRQLKILMCKNEQKPELETEPCYEKTELRSWRFTHENQELQSRRHVHEKKSSATGAGEVSFFITRLRSPGFYPQIINGGRHIMFGTKNKLFGLFISAFVDLPCALRLLHFHKYYFSWTVWKICDEPEWRCWSEVNSEVNIPAVLCVTAHKRTAWWLGCMWTHLQSLKICCYSVRNFDHQGFSFLAYKSLN